MTEPTLTAAELAAELGRSVAWVLEHRQAMQKMLHMPRPLPGGPPLVWDRAQIYAWKDRALPRDMRIAAMAYRAAEAAARGVTDDGTSAVAVAREALDAIYATR